MKKLIIISFLLLVGGYGFGQENSNVIGVWVRCWNGFSHKKIEFKKDGTYRQYLSSCVGSGKGKGTYKVDGNVLTMNFSVGEKERKFLIEGNKLYSYNKQTKKYAYGFDVEKTKSLSYKNAFENCKGLIGF